MTQKNPAAAVPVALTSSQACFTSQIHEIHLIFHTAVVDRHGTTG